MQSLQQIIERTTSIIITFRQTGQAAIGGQHLSVVASPPANKLWLVQHLGCSCEFAAAPAAGDHGAAHVHLMNGALFYEAEGSEVSDPFGLEPVVRGHGCHLVLDDTMGIRLSVDANASTVAVDGVATAHIMEFEPLP